MLVVPFKPALFRQLAELAGADEQAAREDIGLDEISAFRISIEQRILHRDILDRRLTAGLQVARDAVHKGRPVFTPKRLDHLHAHDCIILAIRIAVILLAEIDRRIVPFARPGKLFVRQAYRRDFCTFRSEVIRQPAPAAADLENASGAFQPIRQGSPLAALGCFQIVARHKKGRGIAHRGVEPLRIEIIAEIVMRMDVAHRTRARVAIEPVSKARRPAERPGSTPGIAQRIAIGGKQREGGHGIGAVPFARLPRLIPADRTIRRQPHQPAPVMQVDFGLETGLAPTQFAD